MDSEFININNKLLFAHVCCAMTFDCPIDNIIIQSNFNSFPDVFLSFKIAFEICLIFVNSLLLFQ